MADTKISALTGATTPLTGAEELPIVQSGATKKVSVDNFTSGRAVTAYSATLNNSGANGFPVLLALNGTGNSGAIVSINGNGATTPNKYIRAYNGALQILNSAISAEILGLSDAGTLSIPDNFKAATPGKGLTVTSPNGTITKTITIDNSGNIALI